MLPFEVWQRCALWLQENDLASFACISRYFAKAVSEDTTLVCRARNPSRLILWLRLSEDYFDPSNPDIEAGRFISIGPKSSQRKPCSKRSVDYGDISSYGPVTPKGIAVPRFNVNNGYGFTIAIRYKISNWNAPHCNGRCPLFQDWFRHWSWHSFATKNGPIMELRRNINSHGSDPQQGLIYVCSDETDFPLDTWATAVYVWVPGLRELRVHSYVEAPDGLKVTRKAASVRESVQDVTVQVNQREYYHVGWYQKERFEGAMSDVMVFQRPVGDVVEVDRLAAKLSALPAPFEDNESESQAMRRAASWEQMTPTLLTTLPTAPAIAAPRASAATAQTHPTKTSKSSHRKS